jgi:glycosyltransferase involved in cell wall biosynthesis
MGDVDTKKVGGVPDPEISVIVPAYNAEPWITETLCSVLDQTIDPASYEIIVVDNGSQDRTLDIAKAALQRAPARVTLSSEPQRGPAHARNHGLLLARGDWIQFLDADDLLHADKLARQLAFAQACSADVGLVFSAWQSLDQRMQARWTKSSSILPDLDQATATTLVRSLISDAGFIPTGAQLFRRSALADVGGYKEVGLIEDVYLYLRLAMAGWDFAHCLSPDPLFCYRRHQSGSLSTGSAVAFADGVVRNAALVESWARAHHVVDRRLSSRLIACYFQAARVFAGRDWARFDAVVDRIEKLADRVIPPGPPALAVLSKLIGYKTAERVALSWRRLKELV